jgi:hypothetical protein
VALPDSRFASRRTARAGAPTLHLAAIRVSADRLEGGTQRCRLHARLSYRPDGRAGAEPSPGSRIRIAVRSPCPDPVGLSAAERSHTVKRSLSSRLSPTALCDGLAR